MKSIINSNLLKLNAGLVLGLVGVALTSGSTYAEDTYVTTATITIPESCSITSTLDTPHTATIPAGIYSGNYNSDGHNYTNGIGQTTIKAFCNDSGGFAIYAIGYTNDTYGNTVLTGPDNNNIATGTATSGGTSNWAMKIGAVSGTYAPTIAGTYGSYSAVPSTYDKVASFGAVTDLTNGSSITTTYAAFIASNQAPGTYNGKVKYTLVHPASETPLQPQTTQAGQICYYPNGSNVEGTMGCQNILASGTTDDVSPTSATLLASNFSREGYGFAGWSKTFDYSDSTGFLGPQETITYTNGQYSGNNNGLSLYAYWIKSAGDLQGWTGCPTLASGAVTALTDQRDNETYAIAKLADGNCWMIENLRLESTNSDNSTGALAQGYGTSTTYGNFSGLADAEYSGFSDTYSANSLYSNDGSNNTINIGTSNYPAYRMPRYNNTNTSARASNPTNNSASMHSYGNYYTWHAAIADTTYYNSGDHGTTSLCPKGWRLPIGNQSTADMSFGKLSVELGGPANGATADSSSTPTGTEMSKVFRSYPNNFLYSGAVLGGSVYYRGSNGSGRFWSSTAYSSGYAYYLSLSSSSVYPGSSSYYKYYGWAVRCVASGV